jgi:hypothetical protein
MNEDREFEAALGRVLAEAPEDAAAQRVLARLETLPAQKRRLAWWPSILMDRDFAPAWPRLAALACAAVLGVSIGLSSYGNRIAADLDLMRVATADDSGTNIFDIDSVTGLRP